LIFIFNLIFLAASAKWKCVIEKNSPTRTLTTISQATQTNPQVPDVAQISGKFEKVMSSFLSGKSDPALINEYKESLFKLYSSTGAEFVSSDPNESSEGEKKYL
jgi:hypothetical protein